MDKLVLKYFGEENTISINTVLEILEYWKTVLIEELPIYESTLGRKGVLEIISSFNYLLHRMQQQTLCGDVDFTVGEFITI